VDYVPVNLRTEQHLGAAYKGAEPSRPRSGAGAEGPRADPVGGRSSSGWKSTNPTPALLPADIDERARVRALAAIVGCDIHPINNRRILESLRKDFGADEKAVTALVPTLDCGRISMRWRRCWLLMHGGATSASEARLRWPTCTSCRRSKSAVASKWT